VCWKERKEKGSEKGLYMRLEQGVHVLSSVMITLTINAAAKHHLTRNLQQSTIKVSPLSIHKSAFYIL
jgi:hypothetical protein